MSEVTSPSGIPQIPAGAQLGGKGADAPTGTQTDTPENTHEFQSTTPLTAKAPPQNPIQEQLTPSTHPQVKAEDTTEVPKEDSTTSTDVNPYKDKVVAVGDSYVQTSIKHLSTELGISEDDFDVVYASALKHNDEGLINPDLLGKELSPEQKVRVQQLAQAAVQETNSRVAHATSTVYRVAGGEAQWETAVQAFNTHAPELEQGYAAYLADQGKLEEAAKYVIDFNTRGGHTNTVVQAQEQGGNGSVQSGLSKAEYTTKVAELAKVAGNRSLASPEFSAQLQDLNARRKVGRSQGR